MLELGRQQVVELAEDCMLVLEVSERVVETHLSVREIVVRLGHLDNHRTAAVAVSRCCCGFDVGLVHMAGGAFAELGGEAQTAILPAKQMC